MRISFDPLKDKTKRAKHSVSLALAARFEWDSAVIWPDTRKDYGEPRMTCLGYIGLRLYAMAFVERASECRIISLRKANSIEVKRYAET